jgi:tetratricopeptide (TPR) repeat protein
MDQRTCDLIFSPNFLFLTKDFIIKTNGIYDYNDEILFLNFCSQKLSCKEIKTNKSARKLALKILEKTKEEYQMSGPAPFIKKYASISKNYYFTIIFKKICYYLYPRLFSYKYLLKHLITLLAILGFASILFLLLEEKGKIVFHPTKANALQKLLPDLDGETIANIIIAEIAEIQDSQKIIDEESKKLGLSADQSLGTYPIEIKLQKDFSSGFSQAIKEIENIELSGTKFPSALIPILMKPLNRFLNRKLISSVIYPKEGEVFFHASDDSGKSLISNSGELQDVSNLFSSLGKNSKTGLFYSSHSGQNNEYAILTQKAISSLEIFSYRLFLSPDFENKSELNWRHIYYITHGWNAYKLQNIKLAKVCFDAVSKIAPENYLTYYSQGLFYYLIKEHEKANNSLLKSIYLNPEKPEEYLTIGIIFSRLADAFKQNGKKLQAIKSSYRAINSALNKNPNYSEAYLARGFLHLVRGNLERATEDFNKVMQIEPNNEYAIILQGTVYYRQDKYQDSVKYFKRALEINPRNIAALNNISVSYIYLNMPDQSIKHLIAGLEINQKDINLLNNLGLAYSAKGDFTLSVEAYSKALGYQYDSEIQSNLAFSFFELGQTKEAIYQWQNALKTDANNVDAEAGLAAGLYQIGNFKKAIEHFNNAIVADPNYCDIQTIKRKYLWPDKSRSVIQELINTNCEKNLDNKDARKQ